MNNKSEQKNSGTKQLFSDAAIYAFANILQRGMMLILLPIYARYFTKSEFGAVDLLYQSILILILISSIGLPQGLPRGFYKENVTEEDNKKLLGVLVIFILPITLLFFFLVWIFSESISNILFNSQGEKNWVQLGALLFVAMVLQQFPMQILKAKKLVTQFSIWSIVTFILVAGSNVYLIVFKEMGLPGMLISSIIGFGSVGVILTARLSANIIINFEWERLKPLLAFGLPMLPALLFRKIIDVSDRYFIPQLHSMDTLGEYVMGVKIANIVEIVVLTPFLFAWQPFFYSIANQTNAKEIFAKVTFYYFMILSFVFLAIIVFAPHILNVIGNGEYSASETIVTILVLASLLNGIQYSISPGIHLGNKLAQEAVCMFVAAIVNIIFNLLLIPEYGGEGAAYATLIAYGFYLVVTFLLANKYYPIKYPYRYIIKNIILTSIFAIILYETEPFILKVIVLMAYLLCGPFVFLYKRRELQWLLQFSQRKQ